MKSLLAAAALSAALMPCAAPASVDEELPTRAEASEYRETSRSADVLAFCRELAARSADARLAYIGRSAGGQPIPMLILGRPAPASPAELLRDERLCVCIQANIHAGEVEGKEAALALARDIVLGGRGALLERLVILVVPNLNPDGNDRVSTENRSYQGGPEGGVGLRANAQGLDINRDWIKLETPEAHAIVRLLNLWDPALLVDCHTTNGSPHREPLTYAPPQNPSGDPDVLLYARETLLADADARLLSRFGYESIPYGTFVDWLDPSRGWRTFGHQPRYTTNYVGLRNRLAVLIETYAFADFRTRVRSTYGFLAALLEHCAENSATISQLVEGADRRAYARAEAPAPAPDPQRDSIAVEVELRPLPEPLEILGYEMEPYTDERGRARAWATEREVTYSLPYFGDFVPLRTVRMPAAYFLDPGMEDVVGKLRHHGIAVERLTRDAELALQRFRVDELESAEAIYQGHISTSIRGEWEEVEETLPAGTWVVRTAQPLGSLAAYMLEPESDDGLLYWNFFDRYLTRQWGGGLNPYPVTRAMRQQHLPTESPAP